MKANVRAALLALPLATAAACGGAGPSVEITAQRSAARPSSEVVMGAGPAERFPTPGMGAPRGPSDGSDDLIDYDLPSGWKVLAATQERYVNLVPAGDPEAACYLSIMPGSAGGLEDNVNRWRKQFELAPLPSDEIAKLPTLEMLGRQATEVELEGTFKGMGSEGHAGFKMIGLLFSEPAGSLFLKFTGPKELVEKERERFHALAASLRVNDPPPGAEHGHGAASAEESSSSLTWRAPQGWVEQAARPMREATFAAGQGAECVVSRFPGDMNGLRSNLDRWSGQFGHGPLDEATFSALQRVQVLGQSVPVLELDGTFNDNMSGDARGGQGMIAVACIRDTESVFIKLTGPLAVVRAERANFIAFVGSLEERK